MADAKKKKPNLFVRFRRYVKDVRGELKKVVWPSRKQAINNTLVVLAFSAMFTIVIYGMDFGLTKLIELLFLGRV